MLRVGGGPHPGFPGEPSSLAEGPATSLYVFLQSLEEERK